MENIYIFWTFADVEMSEHILVKQKLRTGEMMSILRLILGKTWMGGMQNRKYDSDAKNTNIVNKQKEGEG